MIDAGLWIVTGIALVGAVGNVLKRRWCFGCWIVSNASSSAFMIWRGIYPQAVLYGVFLSLSIWGLVAWKDEDAP